MKKVFAIMAVLAAVLLVAVLTAAPPAMGASGEALETGSTTGTGAIITVSMGFQPRYIVVTNASTTNIVKAEWDTGMATWSCLKTLESATAANIISVPTTSCISTYAGTKSAAPGFKIGADTDLNISGDTLRWKAWR